MRRLDVYRDWLLEHVLQVDKQNALVVLPITSQAVDYRDDPVEWVKCNWGLSNSGQALQPPPPFCPFFLLFTLLLLGPDAPNDKSNHAAKTTDNYMVQPTVRSPRRL